MTLVAKQPVHQVPRWGIPGLVVELTPTCEWVVPNTELPVFFFHTCQGLLFQWLRSPCGRIHHHWAGFLPL